MCKYGTCTWDTVFQKYMSVASMDFIYNDIYGERRADAETYKP